MSIEKSIQQTNLGIEKSNFQAGVHRFQTVSHLEVAHRIAHEHDVGPPAGKLMRIFPRFFALVESVDDVGFEPAYHSLQKFIKIMF